MYARRRGGVLETAGDSDCGGESGSSEVTTDSSRPWTARTGLRADVPLGSAGPPFFEAWEPTRPSMTDSRSLLGVVRRVDRKDQKRSGVNPLRRC